MFIQDMGTAYRASGRTTPIMDGLAFHPYEDNSSIAPESGRHPNSKTIAIADYDKLVTVLGTAFDGTAQRGSTLPIFYTEFGVESQIPAAKASLYTGVEPAAVKPVTADVQGLYYRQAIGLAFCQPNVRAISLFHVFDEPDLNRWQSGLYYVDGKAKASLPIVKKAIAETHRGAVAQCPNLHLRPRLSHVAAKAKPQPAMTFRCDLDCDYTLAVRSGKTTVTRTGTAVGGADKRVLLGRLKRGRYTIQLSVVAHLNRGVARTAGARLVIT